MEGRGMDSTTLGSFTTPRQGAAALLESRLRDRQEGLILSSRIEKVILVVQGNI